MYVNWSHSIASLEVIARPARIEKKAWVVAAMLRLGYPRRREAPYGGTKFRPWQYRSQKCYRSFSVFLHSINCQMSGVMILRRLTWSARGTARRTKKASTRISTTGRIPSSVSSPSQSKRSQEAE